MIITNFNILLIININYKLKILNSLKFNENFNLLR